MTTTSTATAYDELLAVIVKAVPEIVELKYGCLIANGWASETNPHRIGIFVQKTYHKGAEHWRMTNGKGTSWLIPNDRDASLTILGRPITLEDVLRAYQQKNGSSLGFGKIFEQWHLGHDLAWHKENAPETIMFLHSLLV